MFHAVSIMYLAKTYLTKIQENSKIKFTPLEEELQKMFCSLQEKKYRKATVDMAVKWSHNLRICLCALVSFYKICDDG